MRINAHSNLKTLSSSCYAYRLRIHGRAAWNRILSDCTACTHEPLPRRGESAVSGAKNKGCPGYEMTSPEHR
ncbi:hypothetical protein CENSYa_0373 [Cenarchaeum symbiosum A]|uniref:Uncharacterized protein n=1 Tax=Cenarchaeum symbiosum (strain A) TaxID=414004 RepID=A0RUJ2_CENSY|nr:hypothetical protein CENSYa_0373 [Cenarchaeum symbiosum A]